MSTALDWVEEINKTLIAMKARPLSQNQRFAVLGTLLTLDPSSPFYVYRAHPVATVPVEALLGWSSELVNNLSPGLPLNAKARAAVKQLRALIATASAQTGGGE